MLPGINSLGVLIHVSGSVLIVVGQTVVKVSHCINESSPAPKTWLLPSNVHAPSWRRPDGRWRLQRTGSKTYAAIGWLLFGIGNMMRFVSMRFAAQTVLSGLQSLQFVVIPFASKYFLGVKSTLSTLIGVIIVLAGNALIVGFGPSEVSFTTEQLKKQWTTPATRKLLLALTGLLLVLHILWRHLRIRGKKWVANRALELELDVSEAGRLRATENTFSSRYEGNEFELLGLRPSSPTKGLGGGLEAIEPHPFYVFTGAILFSAVASMIGAWSVLFSKSLTYVVSEAPASLMDWYSWLIGLAFLGTAGFWVRKSNSGLRLYPVCLIMPLMQAFWMCMSVVQGAVYFDELHAMATGALSALCIGLSSALGGALLMGLAGYRAESSASLNAPFSAPPPAAFLSETGSVELSEKVLYPHSSHRAGVSFLHDEHLEPSETNMNEEHVVLLPPKTDAPTFLDGVLDNGSPRHRVVQKRFKDLIFRALD